MPRLWIGNFDFEHRLADPLRTLPARLQRLNAELAPAWLAVSDEGDAIWTPEPVPATFWEMMSERGFPRVNGVTDWRPLADRYELTPWGWTPDLLATAPRVAPHRGLPSAVAVRTANSRRWSFARETEWGGSLPDSACCASIEEVAQAIAALPNDNSPWVVKAEFGMSGRERLLGRGALTATASSWLQRRLRADGVAFFEPWVDRIAEAGILLDVPPAGSPQLIGVAEMLPSPQGQYAGSAFAGALSHVDWSPAVECAHRAAVELQRLGYQGPLGIDAMWYRTADGEPRLRPLQDVNARWTMGRLALGWRRFFPHATFGAWQHAARGGTSVPAAFSKSQPIATSPEMIGGQPVSHQTMLVVHPRV